MKKVTLNIGAMVISLLAFWACGDDSDEVTAVPTTNLVYGDVSALIDNNCATSGCHAAASKSGDVDLSSYSGVTSSAASSAAEMRKGDMPTPGSNEASMLKANASDAAKILEYFEAGAPQ